jgi:molecular chaperone GrpE
MTDTTARPSDDAAERPDEAAAAPADEKKIAELVEALARESAEYKDKMLRTLAEMENLRRRTEREVSDARTYGVTSFARDILSVADNINRALQALEAEGAQGSEAGIKSFIEGVQLTERDLLKTLEKNGLRKFEPTGERFDPNLHQAMYEVADPSLPAGTVAQVVQAGYMIGERVLRPALVAVSKGGPKAAPSEPPANDNAGGSSSSPDGD